MLGTSAPGILMDPAQHRRKRKADTHDDRERLSKRLSRLNIEQSGSRLYVPVEAPANANANANANAAASSKYSKAPAQGGDESMQVDDSKHKVYIYDLDAELSSDSDTDDGRLVFLPDIEKHLRENRIPRRILANDQGELAGMQLVLYSDPKSISVPEEKDGVRRAIIEARQRAREGQRKPDNAGEMRSNGTASHASSLTAETMPHSNPAPALFFPADDACDAMEVD